MDTNEKDINEGTFNEVNKSFTIKEAIMEAKRCLNCKNPSCKKGCPIENDIPDFIHQLSMGNMGEAMRIINEKRTTFRPSADGYAPTKTNARAIACSTLKAKAYRWASWNGS